MSEKKSPVSPLNISAALRAAVASATPAVPMPRNAPSCPGTPRENANMKNEPKPAAGADLAGASTQRNVQNEPIKYQEMSDSVRKCPVESSNTQNSQNEPTADFTAHKSLTPRQLTAISALFAGHSFSQTAAYLRIDRKTLYRWRSSAPFIA